MTPIALGAHAVKRHELGLNRATWSRRDAGRRESPLRRLRCPSEVTIPVVLSFCSAFASFHVCRSSPGSLALGFAGEPQRHEHTACRGQRPWCNIAALAGAAAAAGLLPHPASLRRTGRRDRTPGPCCRAWQSSRSPSHERRRHRPADAAWGTVLPSESPPRPGAAQLPGDRGGQDERRHELARVEQPDYLDLFEALARDLGTRMPLARTPPPPRKGGRRCGPC